MSHLRWAWTVVLGIAAGGGVLAFDDDDRGDPPPPVEPVDPRPPNEIGPFSALMCTGDQPGSPTCPFNEIPLDELGVKGTFRFIVTAIGTGLYLNRIEAVAGPEGLYLDLPTLRFRSSPEGVVISERSFDAILNLEPGGAATLGTAAVVGHGAYGPFSLHVRAIGPYRP
jgi:hypothetical protein